MGRIGSMIAPVLYEYLFEFTDTFVLFFLLMVGCAFLDVILIHFMPFETKNMLLASDFQEFERQKSIHDIYGTFAKREQMPA